MLADRVRMSNLGRKLLLISFSVKAKNDFTGDLSDYTKDRIHLLDSNRTVISVLKSPAKDIEIDILADYIIRYEQLSYHEWFDTITVNTETLTHSELTNANYPIVLDGIKINNVLYKGASPSANGYLEIQFNLLSSNVKSIDIVIRYQ